MSTQGERNRASRIRKKVRHGERTSPAELAWLSRYEVAHGNAPAPERVAAPPEPRQDDEPTVIPGEDGVPPPTGGGDPPPIDWQPPDQEEPTRVGAPPPSPGPDPTAIINAYRSVYVAGCEMANRQLATDGCSPIPQPLIEMCSLSFGIAMHHFFGVHFGPWGHLVISAVPVGWVGLELKRKSSKGHNGVSSSSIPMFSHPRAASTPHVDTPPPSPVPPSAPTAPPPVSQVIESIFGPSPGVLEHLAGD